MKDYEIELHRAKNIATDGDCVFCKMFKELGYTRRIDCGNKWFEQFSCENINEVARESVTQSDNKDTMTFVMQDENGNEFFVTYVVTYIKIHNVLLVLYSNSRI